MNLLVLAILAVVQGAAELLPISSSAHVILVEKIFGLDPTSPQMTFLLVMLHTGTMLAVLVYFWSSWARLLSSKNSERASFVRALVYATIATGLVGLGLLYAIEKVALRGTKGAAVESLFGNVWIIGTALAAVGVLIIVSGFSRSRPASSERIGTGTSLLVGVVQGLALPFRGFSRSGSTISVALLGGLPRRLAEELSFALAFILTIPVVGREALRLRHAAPAHGLLGLPVATGLLGMVLSFAAGLLAIRWLSVWLERGRWGYFGIYCVALSAVLLVLAGAGVLR